MQFLNFESVVSVTMQHAMKRKVLLSTPLYECQKIKHDIGPLSIPGSLLCETHGTSLRCVQSPGNKNWRIVSC